MSFLHCDNVPQSPCKCGGWAIWEMQWWEIWNSGPGEILKNWIYSNLHNTCRKPTPTPWIVNEKKFWPVPSHPWHVCSYFWPFFGVIWSIFSVKNRFSHIFPAPGGSPYQSLFLRHEIEKRLRAVYPKVKKSFFSKTNMLRMAKYAILTLKQVFTKSLGLLTPSHPQFGTMSKTRK